MDLEPIAPGRAVEMYIADRQPELSQATIYSHRSRLSHFTRWCNQEDIEEMRELSGLKLHEYRLWRREDGGINSVTEKTQMDTLRVFIRWCESVDAVPQNLSEKVLSPSLSNGENEREKMVEPDVIRSILDYLETYEYASSDHVTLLLMWRCLLRRGAVRAIDLDDAHLNDDDPYLEIHHRPDTGTPLKNQEDAELAVEAPDGETDRINSMAEAYLNQLSDSKSGVARKNIRAHWNDTQDTLEQEKKVANGEAVVFTALIGRTLTSVTKKVTTDKSSNEETEFVLKFDDDNSTRLTVTQSTLFEGRALWKAYTAAQGGEYPERIESEEVEWDNWMGGVLEDVGEDVEEEVGARTAALRALENHVSNAASYGNRTDAVENGGVYVDDEPPANDEVLVPREAVASIVSTHDITDRKLQLEISARELSGPSTAGDTVSMSTTLNGNWQTFWVLSGDAFDVDEDAYSEEAADVMDRMEDATVSASDEDNNDDDDDEDGTGSDDGEDVVNSGSSDDDDSNPEPVPDVTGDDGDDGNAPGKIGSYGPGSGGDE